MINYDRILAADVVSVVCELKLMTNVLHSDIEGEVKASLIRGRA